MGTMVWRVQGSTELLDPRLRLQHLLIFPLFAENLSPDSRKGFYDGVFKG